MRPPTPPSPSCRTLRPALGARPLESLLLLLLSKRKHRTNKKCIQRNFLSYLTISRDNLFKHPQTLPPALDHGGTGWSSASSSTALPSRSLPLPLSTSPSPSPPPFFFFPVFMTFTHFLFNEKKN